MMEKVTEHAELEDVGVDVSEEDTILSLTMGLDKSYDSFIISLNTTPRAGHESTRG
jgi:hypothetical protein